VLLSKSNKIKKKTHRDFVCRVNTVIRYRAIRSLNI